MAVSTRKPPSVLSFISSKGGSGKTVTSLSMARLLAHLNYKTLLVDADASTNGLTLLCLPQVLERKKLSSSARGIFDDPRLGSLTTCEIEPNLYFIPATYTMTNTEESGLTRVTQTLQELRGLPDWDFVFLDAQAGIDPYAKAAAEIADQVIIVSEYDPISVQGIERLKIVFSDIMGTRNTWILFNKVLPEFAKAIGEGLAIARYLPPIIWDADVVRAFATRRPILDLVKPNVYAATITRVLKTLFPGAVSDLLDAWVQEHEKIIQEPFVNRLAKIEDIITQLESERISIELAIRSRASYSTVLLFGWLASVTTIIYLLYSSSISEAGFSKCWKMDRIQCFGGSDVYDDGVDCGRNTVSS